MEAARKCDSEPNTATIDFVIKLPIEILPNLFTRLSFEELTIIKSVSRSWKDRVITCPEAWSTLKLSKNTLKEFEPHISSIKPYVTELKLVSLSDDQCQNIFTQGVHGGHFKGLQIINIKSNNFKSTIKIYKIKITILNICIVLQYSLRTFYFPQGKSDRSVYDGITADKKYYN